VLLDLVEVYYQDTIRYMFQPLLLVLILGIVILVTSDLNEDRCDMGIFVGHLRECVIVPTLKGIGLYSEAAVELLVGTAAHESHGGHWLKQKRGPAQGIYQQEKATLVDMWENWIRFHPGLRDRLNLTYPDPERLQWDLRYATLWARLQYFRAPAPLPEATDLKGLAQYWYKNWCKGCKGTVGQWLVDYQRYVSTP